MFALDNTKSKEKDAILACLYEIFQETKILKEETIYTDWQRREFKNKSMMKVLLPFTWNYFAIGYDKGVTDGIGGDARTIVRQQVSR